MIDTKHAKAICEAYIDNPPYTTEKRVDFSEAATTLLPAALEEIERLHEERKRMRKILREVVAQLENPFVLDVHEFDDLVDHARAALGEGKE